MFLLPAYKGRASPQNAVFVVLLQLEVDKAAHEPELENWKTGDSIEENEVDESRNRSQLFETKTLENTSLYFNEFVVVFIPDFIIQPQVLLVSILNLLSFELLQ